MSADNVIGFIKLSHFSVKEYLMSEYTQNHKVTHIRNFSFNNEQSHSVISQICLAYLLHFNTSGLLDMDLKVFSPLANYAARHWISHTHSSGKTKSQSPVGFELMMKLLTDDGAFFNWI